MHEFNCFDCEMYADEVELPENYQIKEDQRCKLMVMLYIKQQLTWIISKSWKMGPCSPL